MYGHGAKGSGTLETLRKGLLGSTKGCKSIQAECRKIAKTFLKRLIELNYAGAKRNDADKQIRTVVFIR